MFLNDMFESSTPLRDLDDYNAKRKSLQDIQLDPATSGDEKLKSELIRRKSELEKQAKEKGIVGESKKQICEAFGSIYAEQLAQQIYQETPDLDTTGRAEELLDAGFDFAVHDLGRKKARYIFAYDEDFASDFVSAYSWLQQGGNKHIDEETSNEIQQLLIKIANSGDAGYDIIIDGLDGAIGHAVQHTLQDMYDEVSRDFRLHPDDDYEQIIDRMMDQIEKDYGQGVAEGDELNVGIEAYGVRGASSKKWRKTFKSQEAFERWLDANEGDVEVLGTREVNLNDMFGEEYDPSYDPEYRPYSKPEQDPDAWKQERDLEEPSAPKTVTIRDADGKVVLTFPSTGGYYGDVRYALSKGFDTERGNYDINWGRVEEDSNMPVARDSVSPIHGGTVRQTSTAVEESFTQDDLDIRLIEMRLAGYDIK